MVCCVVMYGNFSICNREVAMSHHCPLSPSKDVDVLEYFRSFLAKNVAVPVAAMNALVVAIKVDRFLCDIIYCSLKLYFH